MPANLRPLPVDDRALWPSAAVAFGCTLSNPCEAHREEGQVPLPVLTMPSAPNPALGVRYVAPCPRCGVDTLWFGTPDGLVIACPSEGQVAA